MMDEIDRELEAFGFIKRFDSREHCEYCGANNLDWQVFSMYICLECGKWGSKPDKEEEFSPPSWIWGEWER